MKRLTSTEEQVMQMFWDNGPSIVSKIIEKMDLPKPPHSTISSIVRILEKKGFLGHKAYGRTYEYFPLIKKEQYSKATLKEMVTNYFNNSPQALVSFLVKEEEVDVGELSELLKSLDEKDKKIKNK